MQAGPAEQAAARKVGLNPPQPFFKTPLLLSPPCFLAVLRFGVPDRSTRIGTGGVSFGCEREGRRGVCAVLSGGNTTTYFPFGPHLLALQPRTPGFLHPSPDLCERERLERARRSLIDAERRVEIDLFRQTRLARAPPVRARRSRISTDRLSMSAYSLECGASAPASERRLT